MIRGISERAFIVVLALMPLFGATLHAGLISPQSIGDAVRAGGDPVQEEGDTRTPKEDARSHRSIGERFLATMRSPMGVSVGFFESYTRDFSASGAKQPMVGFTMLRPRIFARTETRRYEFQFDYTFGYRGNNKQRQIRSTDHSVKIDFARQLSRYASLRVSNSFGSAFNDEAVLPSSPAPVMYQSGFAQELYVPRQHFTTNSLVTSVNYQAGKRSNITVFGSYAFWNYGSASFGKTQGFQVGIRSDYRVNKWLYLNNSYSHYLNKVDPRFQPGSIQRLQFGGLKFKPTRNVELYLSGGVDSARIQGAQRTAGAFQSGISKTAGSTLFSLVYHRGFSIAGGPGTLLNSDNVSASFSQWLTRRVNVHFTSGYVKGASVIKGSKLQYISGAAELEIAIHRHVVFSTQYTSVSQRGANLDSTTPALNRHSVMSGLQFFFASSGAR